MSLGAAVFVVVWFEPQALLIDRRVDEAVPGSPAALESPTGGASPGGSDGETPAPPSGPVTLARGAFRPLEHDVIGTALVLELPDGRRYLRFEGLNVSNGPDLKVYLSTLPANRGWHDYDDAPYESLGDLKGNLGDQNYRLDAGLDLSRFRSAVVWCKRFAVGFAVAPLDLHGA